MSLFQALYGDRPSYAVGVHIPVNSGSCGRTMMTRNFCPLLWASMILSPMASGISFLSFSVGREEMKNWFCGDRSSTSIMWSQVRTTVYQDILAAIKIGIAPVQIWYAHMYMSYTRTHAVHACGFVCRTQQASTSRMVTNMCIGNSMFASCYFLPSYQHYSYY